MDWNLLHHRLHEPSRSWQVALLAVLILGGLAGLHQWLNRRLVLEHAQADALAPFVETLAQTLDHTRLRRDLKVQDVAQLKAGFSDQATHQKTLFETGLSLQEERRLLEKQLELMTTYLTIDPTLLRLFLMRGEQPLESYRIGYFPPRVFPVDIPLDESSTDQIVVSSSIALSFPRVVRIISKERFAHPERGHSEQVNGQFQYNPPQVGTSIRSNALGEYVIFTNNKLILHGPPVNDWDHENFPHICLGLDLNTARKLYQHSYIGTKILLKFVAPTKP